MSAGDSRFFDSQARVKLERDEQIHETMAKVKTASEQRDLAMLNEALEVTIQVRPQHRFWSVE